MAAKNDILKDKDGNQIFPATTAEQVSYDGEINVKQAIKRGAVRNKVAPTVASMTDKEQIYVYTGTEDGYTFGNWYYWNGTAWTSGGTYNAVEVNTDGTLTEEGAPADANATGLAIDELKEDLVQKVDKPSEDGTDGQVLARDADGNIVWQDAMKELENGVVTPSKLSFYNSESPNIFVRLSDINLQAETIKPNATEKPVYESYLSEAIKIPQIEELWLYSTGYKDNLFSYLHVSIAFYDESGTYIEKSAGTGVLGDNSYFDRLNIKHLVIPDTAYSLKFITTKSQYDSFPFNNALLLKSLDGLYSYRKWDSEIIGEILDENGLGQFEYSNLAKYNGIAFGGNSDVKEFPKTNCLWSIEPLYPEHNVLYMYIRPRYYYTQDGDPTSIGYVYYCNIACYDSDGNLKGELGANNENNDCGTYRLLDYELYQYGYAKFILSDEVKSVRVELNGNIHTTLSANSSLIFSYDPIEIDMEKDTAIFVRSEPLERWYHQRAQQIIDNNEYYRFTQIGRLLNQGNTKYVAWNPNGLYYDNTRNKFVLALRGSASHASNTYGSFFTEIKPLTYKSNEPMTITDGIDTVCWIVGFVLDDSDNYILFGIVESSISVTTPIYKFTSEDGGATWINQGEITIDTSNATDANTSSYNYCKFFRMHRMSDGTLLASYDDTVSPVNGKYTLIARSIDDGATWTLIEVADTKTGACECFFFEIDDIIMMMGRLNAYGAGPNHAVISYSYDRGETWTTPFYSKTLENHAQGCSAFIHDDIVEVFAADRAYNGKPVGKINHYSCTKEQALNDEFLLREVFYSQSNVAADLTGCSIAQDRYGKVLVLYSDSEPGSSTITSPHFLLGGKMTPRTPCCDALASDMLPYSGSKIQELIDSLDERISKLE